MLTGTNYLRIKSGEWWCSPADKVTVFYIGSPGFSSLLAGLDYQLDYLESTSIQDAGYVHEGFPHLTKSFEMGRFIFNTGLLRWEHPSFIWATPSGAAYIKSMGEETALALLACFPSCWCVHSFTGIRGYFFRILKPQIHESQTATSSLMLLKKTTRFLGFLFVNSHCWTRWTTA